MTSYAGSDEGLLSDSDNDGNFLLGPFRIGQLLNVGAWSNNAGSSRIHEVTPPRQNLPLRLSQSIRVFGHLQDAETKEPVPEYKLYAIRNMFPPSEITRIGIEGELSERVDVNTILLIVESPGHLPKFWQMNLVPGNDHDLGSVLLQRGRFISGRVVDANGGSKVEDALIVWRVYEQLIAGGHGDLFIRNDRNPDAILSGLYVLVAKYMARSLTTDSEGEFFLGPLPHDRVRLEVFASDYKERTIHVPTSENDIEVSLRSQPAVAVSKVTGRVETTTGVPIPNIFVYVQGRFGSSSFGPQTKTADDGSFEFSTEVGTLQIRARSDLLGKSNTASVKVREDVVEHVRLVMYTQSRLALSLVGLQGVETADLTIEGMVPIRARRYVNDLGNGEHVIQGLRRGSYRISAKTSTGRENSTWVELPKDAEARTKIVFSGAHRLYGTLVNREALASWDFQVLAQPKDRKSASARGEVYSDGSYEVRGLANGKYSVFVLWFRAGLGAPYRQRLERAEEPNTAFGCRRRRRHAPGYRVRQFRGRGYGPSAGRNRGGGSAGVPRPASGGHGEDRRFRPLPAFRD